MPEYKISTHTSLVGCDSAVFFPAKICFTFLLTHPLWDVTGLNCNPFRHSPFLLTHPLWDVTSWSFRISLSIKFLLTHPLWDVTAPCRLFHLPYYISTHTSLVGCDSTSTLQPSGIVFLLTHPLWDVSICYQFHIFIIKFLLTHPLWDVRGYP